MSETLTPAERSIQAGDNRKFVGHPRGLATLFNVEMWERFSFYGMKAILAYYIYASVDDGKMSGLGYSKATAAVIVATYGAAVYLLSVVGGYAADRLIGARRSTLYGGIIIMLGHISMAIPGAALFTWLGLVLISIGTGFLKPNISTMVGELYAEKDPRRDAGFEIFYMSINIGSFFSPFVVAFLKDRWGYHAGFAAAAVGMAFALVFYVIGTKGLHGAGEAPTNPLSPAEKKRLPLLILGIVAGCAVIFIGAYALRGWNTDVLPAAINDVVFIVAVIASVYYFVSMYRHPQTSAVEKKHLLAYIPLFIGACMFWMVFEQAAGNMAIFAEGNTNLRGLGIDIDPEWYQSVNPLAVVAFAPFFAWLFTRRAGRFPSTPTKFAIGVLIIGVSAFMMWWLFRTYPGGAALAPFWMLGFVFVFQTIGELFLSPVGLSATTTLAPRHFASQVMGLWFLTSSVGQGLAGQIIDATKEATPADSYLINGVITLVIAVVLFLLVPWTRRQMQDIEDHRREAIDEVRGRGSAVPAAAVAEDLPPVGEHRHDEK